MCGVLFLCRLYSALKFEGFSLANWEILNSYLSNFFNETFFPPFGSEMFLLHFCCKILFSKITIHMYTYMHMDHLYKFMLSKISTNFVGFGGMFLWTCLSRRLRWKDFKFEASPSQKPFTVGGEGKDRISTFPRHLFFLLDHLSI